MVKIKVVLCVLGIWGIPYLKMDISLDLPHFR